jgi:hypothetical protein
LGPGAGLLTALLASGCLPFAAPPAKVGFAIGPGSLPSSTLPDRFASQRAGVASQFSGGVYPLGWFPSQRERAGDVGVGYLLERYSDDGPQAHGPFIDLELYLWRHVAAGHSFRLGSIAAPSILFWRDIDGQHRTGAGIDVKLELELYGFLPGNVFENEADAVYGYAYGEWSLGAWVGGGYRDVFGSDVWTTWLGFNGRWPAIAGVLCCWQPGD